MYQPAANVAGKRPRGLDSLPGIGMLSSGAGLCIRVDDSAWSRPLNISMQGAGGPFQVIHFSCGGLRCKGGARL